MSRFAKTAAKIAAILLLAEVWSACVPDLNVPAGAVITGSRARVTVWVFRTDPGPVTVSVSGVATFPDLTDLPDGGGPNLFNDSFTTTITTLNRPTPVEFDFGATAPLLVSGVWDFDILVTSQTTGVDDWTTTCRKTLLSDGVLEPVDAFEPHDACSTNVLGDFPWELEHDLGVLRVVVSPNPAPVGATVSVTADVRNSSASELSKSTSVVFTANGITIGSSQVTFTNATRDQYPVITWNTSGLSEGVPIVVTATIPEFPGERGIHPVTGDPFGDLDNNSSDTPFELTGADQDLDGILDNDPDNPDNSDNCPAIPNFNQDDVDGDKVGDACDICEFVVSPRDAAGMQPDADGDGIGDACDTKISGFAPQCEINPAGSCNLVANQDCDLSQAPTASNDGCLLIYGEGFDPVPANNIVTIGGSPLPSNQVWACNTTSILVDSPGGFSNDTLSVATSDDSDMFLGYNVCPAVGDTLACPPGGGVSVSGLSPIGVVIGGAPTTVFVFGCGFQSGAATVRIGSVSGTNVNVILDSILTFTVPSNMLSGRVTVEISGSPPVQTDRVLRIIN